MSKRSTAGRGRLARGSCQQLIDFFCAEGRQRLFAPRSTIFREGDSSNLVYLICRGRVVLLVQSGNVRRQLRCCAAGDFLGFSVAFSGKPEPTTAQTLSECTLRLIDRQAFLSFLLSHEDSFFATLRLLSQDVNESRALLRRLGAAAGG